MRLNFHLIFLKVTEYLKGVPGFLFVKLHRFRFVHFSYFSLRYINPVYQSCKKRDKNDALLSNFL